MFRIEKPTINDWLFCPDISLFYEALNAQQAFAAWRSGQQAAKEVDAAIKAETAHQRIGR